MVSVDYAQAGHITVDGVVEATDDWFTQAGNDPELDAVLAAQRDASDGFLVGRVTFEGMRDYGGPKTDDTITPCRGLIAADLVDEYRLFQ